MNKEKAQRSKSRRPKAKAYCNTPLRLLAILCCFILYAAGPAHAANETHLDTSIMPAGCGSCHKSHGRRATLMLDRPEEKLCFKCHEEIYSEILKRSSHPVIQTSRYHITAEILPERSPSTPRHVSCFDCHNPHLLTEDNPVRGVRGYSGRGMVIKKARNEYEVCYKCHSDSANLPPDASNIAQDFYPGNASFHPVEATGKNRDVPSLERDLSTLSTTACSDCHGNDDKAGPAGPHGSSHEFMLKENYSLESGSESPYAYELCYECHRRASILNDESFKAHKRHVIYGKTSCYACHDPHGSVTYDNLINFDTGITTPNNLGQLNFLKLVPGKPRCLLSCHVDTVTYEHKTEKGQYCINDNCPPGW